jgi:phage FluMu gp28-like protein
MTYELIRSCQDVRLQTIVDWAALRQREREAYVGVDVGRVRDVTVAWIWERREGGPAGKAAGDDMPPEATFTTRGVAVLASAPFAQQEAFIANLMRQPAVRRCCVDATGLGMHLAERLAARFGEDRVEAVTFTNAIKGELAGALRVLAERGCVWIPPEEDIMRDWHSLTRTVTSSGHIRLDANRSGGGHADRFWAAALGIHAAGNGGSGGPPGLMTSGRLQFVKGL